MDFFIFRSTWDLGYHFETTVPVETSLKDVRGRRSREYDNVDRLIKDFEKENFTIGRSTINRNNFE